MVHNKRVYVLKIVAFNGMDALMRLSNMMRRAKLRYRSVSASFNENTVKLWIEAMGDPREVRWLSAKIEKMPEVHKVTVTSYEEDFDEHEWEMLVA